MRRSKYPSLGILDALSKSIFGFSIDPTRNGLYESLPLEQRPSRETYSKILNQLERSGYIQRRSDRLKLRPKGKLKAQIRHIEQITLPKKHDGEYRLIAFDIPETMRHARDIIRSKLKAFQCTKIQKSLYMTPYICEKEIEEVCNILRINRYVTVLRLSKNFAELYDRSNQRSNATKIS